MKNADLFIDTFGTYATEIWSMPEKDFLKWLNEDAEPKTGHWIWQTEDIYRCSECGNDIRVKEVMNIPQYVRCPMCEAKMQEVGE